jgi:hypothetical protein
MDELLKKLLEAEVLTEETKSEIEIAVKKQIDETMSKAREEATAQVTAELNEQWIAERETLIEALDAKITEALTEEIADLKADIDRFRDLEAEYAEKIVEAKSEMADTLKNDVAQLIEKLDAFLEVRLSAELEELREDFDVVKKQQFGKTVFEAFVTEFKKHYAADDSVEAKLNETEQRLEDALSALESAEKKAAKLDRSIKLEKVLAPLSGRSREVMEAILKNVETSMLEEAYKTYVGRVLKETTEVETSEKEGSVLAEGEVKPEVSGVAKSGDDATLAEEQQSLTEADRSAETSTPTITEAEKLRLRRLAGLA